MALPRAEDEHMYLRSSHATHVCSDDRKFDRKQNELTRKPSDHESLLHLRASVKVLPRTGTWLPSPTILSLLPHGRSSWKELLRKRHQARRSCPAPMAQGHRFSVCFLDKTELGKTQNIGPNPVLHFSVQVVICNLS